MNKLSIDSKTYGKLLLQGAHVIDPQTGLDDEVDLLLEGEVITAVGKNLPTEQTETVNLRGKMIIPGMVDAHVHLREPGFETRETLATGARAAVAGGFTAVCAMPNTAPVVDNRGVAQLIRERTREAPVHIYPIAAITYGLDGKDIVEMADLAETEIAGFSDDGHCVQSAAVMRNAMKYADMLKLPIVSHCQDNTIFGAGVMNESEISTRLGLVGIPTLAEDLMAARELLMAEYDSTAVHLAHVSTLRSVEMIRAAKARGVRVTAEATPHHFTLTDKEVSSFNPNYKMSPPLRGAEDVAAVIEGLSDGTLDIIVTDHAPHTWEDKCREYDFAPFGIIGLETALGLAWRELIQPEHITLEQWIHQVSVTPRQIFPLPEVRIEQGGRAELTLIDPLQEWTYLADRGLSRSRNTPFDGEQMKGRPLGVVACGKLSLVTGIE